MRKFKLNGKLYTFDEDSKEKEAAFIAKHEGEYEEIIEEVKKPEVVAEKDVPAATEGMASQLENGSLELPKTKYNTPLTRDERVALQNNKFMRQMSKENNITKERLDELTEINADPVIELSLIHI